MVIKIVKKTRAAPAPAPVVQEPEAPKEKPEPAKFGDGWQPGPDDKPRPCKVCGNLYWRPCDGMSPNCIAARWHAQKKADQQPTLP